MIPPLENSDFVAHMELVLDVYKTPYDEDFPVVWIAAANRESSKQLIKHTPLRVAAGPGREVREDYEGVARRYERCGVANIFMANEPLRGKRYVKVTERKTKIDWATFIKELADQHYPSAKKIRLVMDNLGTHKPAAL